MDAARGDGVRRWLAGLPAGVRRLVVVVVVVFLYGPLYLVAVLVLAWVNGRSPDWTEPIGSMVGATLGVAIGTWMRRRRMGSCKRVREFTVALRTRRLPDDADPAVWAPLLTGERRALRRSQAITLPLLALLFTGAAISAGVLGLGGAGASAMVLVGFALVAVLWLVSRRSAARLDHLADQLPRN